jgi:hypothetical protein
MIWNKQSSFPKFLTMDDLDDIKKSDKLFARKFDIRKDKEVLDALNKS